MPVFGEGDGDGGGCGGAAEVEVRLEVDDRDEDSVIVVDCVVVFEGVDDPVAEPDAPACMSLTMPARAAVSEAGKVVVLDCALAPDVADCISPIIPVRAEVSEGGNAVEPDGNSICVSGQEPSLFA